MKIGILTYYFADNYGAVLQCYALKMYLESIGHKVEVIDYKPFDDRKITHSGQVLRNIYRVIRQFFYDVKNNGLRKKQIKKFDDFREMNFNIGISDYDVIFLGSDQIWNPKINQFDYRYFGQGLVYKKSVSYAASIGISELDDGELNYIKKGLKLVDYISVREETGKSICEKISDKSIEIVADPVFLINKQFYFNIMRKNSISYEEKYVLVYSLEHNELIDKYAKKIANEHGLKIKYIHPHGKHLQYADQYEDLAGPIEFLNLFQNASFIVSNSFHALAFSMIFEIPIISVMHKGGSSRQVDLIKASQLFYEKIDENTYLIKENKITDLMQESIEKSKEFIAKVLG